ncbi:coiled-coil-helix-coiled-coil-helix domain-containing protein 5 isoform X3 [Carcharodon carcharias]|uniref:coiled-coil-helix-coiled-coil-helix domain-containing protein 5 isoform X3 n=2 Tax=Carcharodon carcharias TaxID=13397 RepID=UPI001B7F5800|nr:coiled-coil-helix-coiled-coil-helix domain-containing protein 5 isoform X3 [Carcharodon carcharias]
MVPATQLPYSSHVARSEEPMQAAFEITARYCSKEMEDYGQCVASNPASWQKDCHQLKTSVAQCTSSHPVIQKIRTECADSFLAFEQCLKQNQSSVLNCTDHVNEFLACAEKVKVPALGAAVQQSM